MRAARGGSGFRGFGRRFGRAVVTVAVAGTSMASLVALDVGVAGAATPRFATPGGLNSGTCTTSTPGTNGPCTLARAVLVSVDTDTINMTAGTFIERVTINKSITLLGTGSGVGGTTIQAPAAPLGAVVTVAGAVGGLKTVTIDGVKITGGTPISGLVGGLVVQNVGVNLSKAVVKNSAITGNTGGIFGGGVVVLVNNEIDFQNTSVTSNTGSNGAGIVTAGKATLTGGSVSNNTTTAAGANTGFGGGIWTTGTGAVGLTANGTTISGNRVTGAGAQPANGGGIYTTGAVSLTNATVSSNQANSASTPGTGIGSGGGIAIGAGGVVTAGTTNITGNTAANGGGVYNLARFKRDGWSISNNTVTSGPANTGAGGGIYTLSAAAPQGVLLSGVTVSGNQALFGGGSSPAAQGGGIFQLTGTVTLNNGTTVNGNTPVGGFGGGIENIDGTISMTGGSSAEHDRPHAGQHPHRLGRRHLQRPLPHRHAARSPSAA